MAKTKRYSKRSKSRKVRRGGRKNNMALQTTQMVGGAVGGQASNTPAPAPAPALTRLGFLDEQSVINSLQSFGDAVTTLESAVLQGKITATSLKDAAAAQETAMNSLQTSVNSLVRSVTGVNGVYKKIVGTDFVATPTAPAPAPV